MKALEDLSYPHRRFAKVGGVGESELGRLEVSFCFLANFELRVDEGMLWRQATAMRNGQSGDEAPAVSALCPAMDTATRYGLPIRPMPVSALS